MTCGRSNHDSLEEKLMPPLCQVGISGVECALLSRVPPLPKQELKEFLVLVLRNKSITINAFVTAKRY
jgi:hypothetical protein